MRYLLDKRMEKELNFRRKYIYDIFHVSTKIINHKQFIELVGIPEDIIDVCFIVGHNNFVQRILQQKKFKEKNLDAIINKKTSELFIEADYITKIGEEVTGFYRYNVTL